MKNEEKSEISVEIGRRLRQVRERTGLTQPQFAKKILGKQGTGGMVSAWETGATLVPTKALLGIFQELGVRPGLILLGREEPPPMDILEVAVERLREVTKLRAAVEDLLLAKLKESADQQAGARKRSGTHGRGLMGAVDEEGAPL